MVMYSYKLIKVGGKLTFCVFAHRGNTVFEFYRRNEDGKRCRNVYRTMMGNTVRIPGFHYGYYKEAWPVENWGKVEDRYIVNKYWKKLSEKDIAKFDKAYPGIKYMLKKGFFTQEDVFDILPIWKKNPKVELLIANGSYRIAYNKSFWKMKEERQKKYLQVLRTMEDKNPTMEKLRCIANGMTEKMYEITHSYEWYNPETRKYCCELDVANYIIRKGIKPREYQDYMNMVKELKKDHNDPYWKFPNNFQKAHQDVLAKCDHARYVRELNEKKAEERKAKILDRNYSRAVKKFLGKTTELDGIKVYVPEKIAEYDNQANILHQCIVECGYFEDVANKKSILVFLSKNDVPYATAELIRKGRKFKLSQFYGDENLDDYEAQPDAVNAFNKWASTYKINFAS